MHMNVAGLMLHIEQPIQAAIIAEREELRPKHLPIHIPHKHTCEFLRPLQAHALVRRQRQKQLHVQRNRHLLMRPPKPVKIRINMSLHDLSIRHLSPQSHYFSAPPRRHKPVIRSSWFR
jgi:hypothetical protein